MIILNHGWDMEFLKYVCEIHHVLMGLHSAKFTIEKNHYHMYVLAYNCCSIEILNNTDDKVIWE